MSGRRIIFAAGGVGRLVPECATFYSETDKAKQKPKIIPLAELHSDVGFDGTTIETLQDWDGWINYLYNGFELNVTFDLVPV